MNRLEGFHESRSDLQGFWCSILEDVVSPEHMKAGAGSIRNLLSLIESYPFVDLNVNEK